MAAKKRKGSENTLMGWSEIIEKQGEGLQAMMDQYQAEKDQHVKNVQLAAELFHKLWGESHDSPNYNKDDWKKLQVLLDKLGIPI